MENLVKNHSEYLQQKSRVDELTQAIQKQQGEVSGLESLMIETQNSIQEVTDKLKPQDATLIPFGGNKGTAPMSYEDTLALKQELNDKENTLRSLSDEKSFKKNALDVLRVELSTARRILNELRTRVADDISAQAADEIAEAVGEQFKKLVCTLQVSSKGNRDIYKIIGVELCNRVFGIQNIDNANIPDIFDSKQRVDEIIEGLS